MTLPAHGPRAPYLLAADQLREDIRAGRLKPGDRLPSSREMRETLGIANATVHAALRVLRDEGLIYSVQGRGTYVSDKPAATAAPEEGAGTGSQDPADSATLRNVLDQMREMSAVMSDLKARVEYLESRDGGPEQASGPQGR